MTGYVTLRATRSPDTEKEGVAVETRLAEVSNADRLFLMDSLAHSLRMSEEDKLMLSLLWVTRGDLSTVTNRVDMSPLEQALDKIRGPRPDSDEGRSGGNADDE